MDYGAVGKQQPTGWFAGQQKLGTRSRTLALISLDKDHNWIIELSDMGNEPAMTHSQANKEKCLNVVNEH